MSNVPVLDQVIDAFIDGRTEFPQFQQVVEEQLARHPEAAEAALKRLDSLRKSKQISTALHALISEEIGRSAKGDITAPIDEPGAPRPAARDSRPKAESKPAPERAPKAESRPVPERAPRASPELRARPVLTDSARQPAPRRAPPPAGPPQIGAVLAGRYRLEALLERGGMSMVYRAADLRLSRRSAEPVKVGLKLVDPAQAGPDAVQALEREAALLAELSHPGVVRMLGFDRHGDSAFMVMELLNGERLRNRLVRSHPAPLPLAEVLRIVRELAEALAYLHARRLVHRDVKPANIFMTASGEVRLIDFGLAAVAAHSGAPGGMAAKAWTPLYASPEMLSGAPPDPRDDVYSLGCVAYEVLTGRHPWGNLPGDQAARKKLKPGRPAGLSDARWKVLRRALSFRGRDRPADAAAFLAEFFPPARPRRLLPWVAIALLGGIAAGVVLSNFGSNLPFVGPARMPPLAPPQTEVPVPAPSLPADPAGAEDPPRGDEPGPVVERLEPLEPPIPVDTAEPEPAAEAEPVPSVEQAPRAPATRAPVGPPALAFTASRFRIGEGDGALRLELLRPEGYQGPLRALWRTVNQTARDGEDFAGSPSWQWIGASSDAPSLVIFIPIVDDSVPGPDLTFLVELREVPGGPPVGAPARAEVTIVDDD